MELNAVPANLQPGTFRLEHRAALRAGRALCVLAILFASGDIWPVFRVGFTFRLAQLSIFLAAGFLLSIGTLKIRTFPGVKWLYGFCLWTAVTLPFSLLIERSLGYVVWTVADILIVFTIVQYYRTEADLLVLIRWHTIAFIALSWFGLLQFALGLRGIDVLVTQWWLPGRLARVNGLSYEPSYYATYLIAGWILASYLLERKATVPSRRLQLTCLVSTTLAILLSSSRMGWLLMALWVCFRVSVGVMRSLLRGFLARSAPRRIMGLIVVAILGGAALLHYQQRVEATLEGGQFLLEGLGLFGESSHSSKPRIDALVGTWDSFLERPIMGSGIGALPVEIAARTDTGVFDLEEAKQYEGMSIFVELLASTGIVGGILTAGFAVSLARDYRRVRMRSEPWQRTLLSAQAWGLVWMLLMLQFNQNFLRIYLFVDLAVLICSLVVIFKSQAQGLR